VKVTIKVNNAMFGGYDEFREVESDAELEALKTEFRTHAAVRRGMTTVTFSCLEKGYFEQIR